MRKNPYLVSTVLTLEVAALCLAALLVRTWRPAAILPRVSLPLLVLLSLIPQVMRLYLAPNVYPPLLSTTLLAGLTFSLLPLCARVDTGLSVWVLFLAGAAAFGGVSLLYGSLARRMASSASGIFTPAAQGVCLYLACQCLQGLI